MSKKVIVKHTDAEKFTVSNMLTVGKEYERSDDLFECGCPSYLSK